MAAHGTHHPSMDFVEISGEPTLTKTTGIPPIRVPLPLHAEMRTGFLTFLWFVAAAFFGLFVALLGLVMLLDPRAGLIRFLVGPGVMIPIIFTINALSYFLDLARRPPLLTINAAGFWDRRATDKPLAWEDVGHAEVIWGRGDILGVHLRLRRPVRARRSARRLSALRYLARRREDELIVPLDFFRKRRTIVRVMLALVSRYGGSVKE